MKDWTIMVYMAGDNNLSENLAFSLEGLGAFAQSSRPPEESKVNLLAYFDGNSLTAPTYYLDYSEIDAKGLPLRHAVTKEDAYHSHRNDDNREIAQDENHLQRHDPNYLENRKRDLPTKQNSASAYSILNFIRWCTDETRQNRKANNYVLIFSGHSFGFHGTSFMRDESSGSYLTLFKFRWALDKANELYFNNGDGKGKIAILGFDSCVMSMLEVGHELRGVAQTMVASEGSLPNSGWGYAPMLREFVTTFNPDQKFAFNSPEYIKAAAKGFVTSFTEYHKKLLIGGRSIDISAWDLEKIEPVTKNVNLLAIELNKHLDLTEKFEKEEIRDKDITLLQELKKVLLQSHFDSQTYMEEQCVDLRDFCLQLVFESRFITNEFAPVFQEIRRLCGEIIKAIDDCVIKCGYSGDEYQFSNGISLYFPWSYVTYFLTDFRYRYLAFNRGEHGDVDKPEGDGKDWNAFLYNFLTRVALRRARKDDKGNVHDIDWVDKSNPPWSKSNPPWSKSNPPWSRSNPPWSKSNPPWSRSNPPWSKSNPPWSKGEVGEYLFYFGRFKNFEMKWDISGYSDDPPEEQHGDTGEPNRIVED